MSVKPIPEGFHSVTPFLMIRDAPGLIVYLKEAFGAVEISRTEAPDGTVMAADLRVGDSPVLVGEARGQYEPMPSSLYLYVLDADVTYEDALAAGGASLMEPADQFYGDRTAGIKDPAGNYWWIATHVEDVSDEERRRRLEQWSRE
jgi:uncharacterized glyoxalase superfamily protein PhnB